ncbi:MAG: hypothetical protein ACQER9_04495, partial [Nanobdellota archaeon]
MFEIIFILLLGLLGLWLLLMAYPKNYLVISVIVAFVAFFFGSVVSFLFSNYFKWFFAGLIVCCFFLLSLFVRKKFVKNEHIESFRRIFGLSTLIVICFIFIFYFISESIYPSGFFGVEK